MPGVPRSSASVECGTWLMMSAVPARRLATRVGRLDHRHPPDLVHLGLTGHVELLPAADEQVGVRHPLHEAERPRPDRLEADLLDVLLGHDRREGEVGQERRRRLLEEEPHPVVVDDLDALEIEDERVPLAPPAEALDPLEGELDVGGLHLPPAVEEDALPQLEHVGLRIGLGPGLREVGHRLEVAVQRGQAGEHGLPRAVVVPGRDQMGIELLDVRRHVDPHRAARLGGRGLRLGAGEEGEAGQGDAALAREAEQIPAAEGRAVGLEDVEDALSVGHGVVLLCGRCDGGADRDAAARLTRRAPPCGDEDRAPRGARRPGS